MSDVHHLSHKPRLPPASNAKVLSPVFVGGRGLLDEPLRKMSLLALVPRTVALLSSTWLAVVVWIVNLVTHQVSLWAGAKRTWKPPRWPVSSHHYKSLRSVLHTQVDFSFFSLSLIFNFCLPL